MSSTKKLFSILLLIFLSVSFFSCTASLVRIPSDDLSKTVRKFYELKKSASFEEAWNYERMSIDEDQDRRENNRTVYINRSVTGIPLKDFEILEIGNEGSVTCGFTPVKIRLVTDWPALPFPSPQGDRVIVMEDMWEKISGKWYHVARGMTKFW